MATTDLGKWMITNGGEYNPDTTYEQLTMVLYQNSTYITLRTVTGIIPNNDKINYILMAQGFSANALADVVAKDTYGVIGDVSGDVSAQNLVDYLTNEVVNNLLKKTSISTVQTNSDNTVPSSSLAYAMQQEITKNKEDIATANSNLGEHFSEAERQIGTWMGKPLYRQCFHPTVDIAAGTQSYNISLGLSGVEVAMIDYAHTWCMGSSNTDVYCIPYVHNDAVNNVGAFLIVENADVKFAIRKGTNTSIRSIWITLTYTKTTDS